MKNKIKKYHYPLFACVLFTSMFLISFLIVWTYQACWFIADPIGVSAMTEINVPKVIREERTIKFYSREQAVELIKKMSKEAGLSDKDTEVLVKLSKCESGWNQFFTLRNDDQIKSIDRGLFAINNKWHPHITNDQAFDAVFNINYAITEYKEGRTSQWLCLK